MMEEEESWNDGLAFACAELRYWTASEMIEKMFIVVWELKNFDCASNDIYLDHISEYEFSFSETKNYEGMEKQPRVVIILIH